MAMFTPHKLPSDVLAKSSTGKHKKTPQMQLYQQVTRLKIKIKLMKGSFALL